MTRPETMAWTLLLATAAHAATTQPATRPTGNAATVMVLDDAGRPASDANVVVVPTPEKLATYYVFDGTLRPWVASGFRQSRTDAAGHCDVRLPDGPAWLVVAHERGWAHVRPPADGEDGVVRLAAWASVHGRAMRGTKPATGWTVMAQRVVDPQTLAADPVLADRTARVAADGSFRIDHLPPGLTRVCLVADAAAGPAAGGAGLWVGPQNVELAPGQNAELQIGGVGRAVEGTIVLPEGTRREDWDCSAVLAFRPQAPARPMPAGVYNGTAEQREAWKRAFETSPEYPKWLAASKDALARTTFTPAAWTGKTTFRVVDVPAGEYTVEVTLTDRKTGRTAEATSRTFTVPPGGPADPAVTVPAVTVHGVAEVATVGRVAPDFAVTMLDGKPVRLSDYRGKMVLLDFWATWCGPCIAEIPHLRAAHDAYAGTGRFVILSVSYDESAAKARDYVRAQKLPWDQAWVGETADEAIGQSYPGGLPTIVLIGPDGRVLARDVRGERIKAEVGKALAAK